MAHGGTSVLAETPEIYGAEHLLTARATTREVGLKLIDRINWWEKYIVTGGGTMDNNPSPGNKAGGITTILEKSLGAVAKAGRADLTRTIAFAGVGQASSAVVARLHAAGIRVQVGTFPLDAAADAATNPATYTPFLDAGVDVIATDNIRSASEAVRTFTAAQRRR